MAGDNPFSALLNPDKQGTITGFVGGLMGKPTAEQAAGGATAQALQELAQYQQGGATPQQALVKYLASPSGIDFFTNAGAGGLKSLTDAMTAMTPPIPIMHNVPPGGTLVGQDRTSGAIQPVMVNPTTEQQNFKYYTDLSKVGPARLRELAELNADPTSKQKDSDKAKALEALTNKFGLDERTKNALMAGLIDVIPAKDGYGNTTGDIVVFDKSQPGNTYIIKSNQLPDKSPTAAANTNAETGPGATPASGAGTGVLPASKGPSATVNDPTQNKTFFGSKADMFLAAGPVAALERGATKVGEAVDPSLILPGGARSEDRQNQLAALRQSIVALAGENGGFGVNKVTANTALSLVPEGGITDSPHAAIQKGIRLYQLAESEARAEEAKTADPKVAQAEKVASSKRAEGWNRVLRQLPTMEELTKMEAAVRNGTAGAPSITSVGKDMIDYTGKVLKKGQSDIGTVADTAASAVGGTGDYGNMDLPSILAVDPRTLSRPKQVQYLNRVRELRLKQNGGK